MRGKTVRIAASDLAVIKKTCDRILNEFIGAKLWLFGSRAKIKAKGGDIDLLLSLPKEPANPVELKIELSQALRDSLGEQKIDIVIEHPGATKSAFHELAKKEGVLLWPNR